MMIRLIRSTKRKPNGFFNFFNRCNSTEVEAIDSAIKRKAQLLLNGWPGRFRMPINLLVNEITEDESFRNDAKNRHIDSRNWIGYISAFRRRLVKDPIVAFHNDESKFVEFCKMIDIMAEKGTEESNLNHTSVNIDTRPTTVPSISTPTSNDIEHFNHECKKYLFNFMIKDAEYSLRDAISAYKTLCDTSDLRIPHEWYPYARLIRRKVIYHGGPTNSGKTYHALKRLKEADVKSGGGLYCGPLRLLALEVYESLNKSGVYTDLSTGQEKREVPFSTHISCTVEMINLNRDYDVAVIDEIQMIGDAQRGYAW